MYDRIESYRYVVGDGKLNESRVYAAYEEAGHAIAALRNGCPVTRLELIGYDPAGGFCHFDARDGASEHSADLDERRTWAHSMMVSVLGGHVATSRLNWSIRERALMWAYEGAADQDEALLARGLAAFDLAGYRATAPEYLDLPADERGLVAWLRAIADTLVRAREFEVDDLAMALMRRGVLTEAAIAAVVPHAVRACEDYADDCERFAVRAGLIDPPSRPTLAYETRRAAFAGA